MKLAIEHLETSLKAGERELNEAREGLKAAERNQAQQTERVSRLEQRNRELSQLLISIRAAPPEKPAERANGKLTLRAKPDALAMKVSSAQ